jgi:hypothetical protein
VNPTPGPKAKCRISEFGQLILEMVNGTSTVVDQSTLDCKFKGLSTAPALAMGEMPYIAFAILCSSLSGMSTPCSIMVLGRAAFGIMTLGKVAFGITTLGRMAFGIMTLG